MMTGENIRLRTMELEDIDRLLDWENDSENWLHSNTLRPFSRGTIERHVMQSHDIYTEQQLRLMITLRKNDVTVGAADLFDCDFTHGRAGVGILIGEPEYRRKGIAVEALEVLANYSYEVLMFHQLYADVLSNNSASVRLFERAGFEQCGLRKNWVKHRNGFYDLILLQRILDSNGPK